MAAIPGGHSLLELVELLVHLRPHPCHVIPLEAGRGGLLGDRHGTG